MPRKKRPVEDRNCSVARTLDILDDGWTFLACRAPFFGIRRFDEIQRSLGIARNLLSTRLQRLVEHGIFERSAYQEKPPRYEYRLTEKGLDLYPAFIEMMRWGDEWLTDGNGPPLILHHKKCGSRFTPRVACSECRGFVFAWDVRFKDGPGAGRSVRVPDRRRRRSSDPEVYNRGRNCSVARTLSILGDRWTFLILREAFFGVGRFDELRRNLGIARNILANRLQNLVANGIFRRRRYQSNPPRYEYQFTKKGVDLCGSNLAMIRWGDRWLASKDGPPLLLVHKTCGNRFTPLVLCSNCGDVIRAREVRYEDGTLARDYS